VHRLIRGRRKLTAGEKLTKELTHLGAFNQILEKAKDADLVSAGEGEEEKSPL
jgi:hypothetical protein